MNTVYPQRLIVLLVLHAFPSAQLFAGDDVNQTLDAPIDAVVSINNIRGDVQIKGWERAEVEVSGELDDLAEELVFTVEGNRVTIDVRMPASDVNWGDGSDLKIYLPMASRVKFVGVSTDVSANNIQGGMQLQTISGDIFARQIGAQLMLSSVSGDIDVDGSSGRLRATTISGALRIESSALDVNIEAVSGDQRVFLQRFDQVSLRSVSGEVKLRGLLSAGGGLDVSSVSGDITLGLQSALDATVNVVAGFGGSIDNRWNEAEVDRASFMGQQLKTVMGDGSAQITLRGVSADITLKQDD